MPTHMPPHLLSSLTTETLINDYETIRSMISPDPDQRVYDLENLLAIAQELARRPEVRNRATARSVAKVSNLPSHVLIAIVEDVQAKLWLDWDGAGDWWNPDKAVGADFIGAIANLLTQYGLAPTEDS